jgi:nucleoporin NUP42
MTKDLTANVDKPTWPLSSYGPAKYEPTLLGGLDESPEELRLRAATALQASNANEYVRWFNFSFCHL